MGDNTSMCSAPLLVRGVPGRHGALDTFLATVHPPSPVEGVEICGNSRQTIGYYVNIDARTSIDKVLESVELGSARSKENYTIEYVIVSWDAATNDIRVSTDAMGAFPAFAGWDGKSWWISTSFREVAARVPSRVLDLQHVVRWLTGERMHGTSTLLRDVIEVPAGNIVLLRGDGTWHSDVCWARPQSMALANDPSAAADAVFSTLVDAVRDSTARYRTAQIAVDLSSGLDSALVAYIAKNSGVDVRTYSMLEGPKDQDCRESIVRSFAARHDLPHDFVDVTGVEPFATEDDMRWGANSPEAIAWSRLNKYLSAIAGRQHAIRLTGEGADEVLSPQSAEFFSIPAFRERHENRLRQGICDLLSPAGVQLAASVPPQRRCVRYRVPEAAIRSRRSLFPIVWHNEVWSFAPYLDLRVVDAARRVPQTDKHELWRHRQDIFLPEQLEPKRGYAGCAAAFALHRTDFVGDVLDNSLLDASGILHKDRILVRLADADAPRWLDSVIGTWLWRVVALEVFLQALGDVELERLA